MIRFLSAIGTRPRREATDPIRRFGGVLLVGVALAALGFALGPTPTATAQERPAETIRLAGAPTNLFASFEPSRPIAGFEIDLPSGWELTGRVAVLRYGSEALPLQVDRPTAANRPGAPTRIRLADPITGPLDVVLGVQADGRPRRADWSITPFAVGEDGVRLRQSARRTQTLDLQSPPDPHPERRALQFRSDAAAPLLLRRAALPSLAGDAPFTVEFWMQTVALDAVVLSTWTGDEDQSYLLEVVTDASGHLRAYTGEPNRHRALLSRRPVADGRWHHVGITYDPAAGGRLRLLVDGTAVDSLSGALGRPLGSPAALALGGRLPMADANPRARYTGLLDEIRVWNRARSPAEIRRFMRSGDKVPAPQAEPTGPDRLRPGEAPSAGAVVVDERLVGERLRSDASSPSPNLLRGAWPAGVEETASTLPVRERLRNLRADAENETVDLRWTAETSEVEAFVVERSTDGTRFDPAATLRPEESVARTASASSPYTRFRYTDESPPAQVVFYRIRQVYQNGADRVSGILKVGLGTRAFPNRPVTLIGNFPNPFAASTTVTFEVNESVPVTLSVWDVTGQRVAQLADQTFAPGYHEVPFEAGSRPSGTYFLRLDTPDGTQSHRMVLLR